MTSFIILWSVLGLNLLGQSDVRLCTVQMYGMVASCFECPPIVNNCLDSGMAD